MFNLTNMKKQSTTGIALLVVMLFAAVFTSCKKNESLSSQNAKPNLAGKNFRSFSIETGLIAYWPLDGNTNDVSGNGHNGTGYNLTATTDRFGNPNSAYHFDGSTSYISVPDATDLRLNGTDFTMNAWVNLDSGIGNVLTKRLAGTADAGWAWSFHSGASGTGLIFFGPGGGSTNAAGYQTINTGQWYMMTSVYTASAGQLDIYLNGVYINSTTGILSPNAAISEALYIGRDDINPSSPGYFFQGSIDEIKIFNSALSASTIQQLYNATSNGVQTGLIAYWPLNNNTNDLSGNSHNGTGYNLTATTDRFGNPNSAYHFDGSTSYISVPDATDLRLNSTDFTVNAWVNLDTGSGNVLTKRLAGTADAGWAWSFHSGGSGTGLIFFGPGGGSTNAAGYQTINTGQWYMMTSVYTASAGQIDIYLNGVYINSTTGILSPNSSITEALYIGRDDINPSSPGYFFQGAIDEIKIFNSALSASTIQQLYNATN